MSVLLANSDDAPERESDYLDLFVQQRVQGVLSPRSATSSIGWNG